MNVNAGAAAFVLQTCNRQTDAVDLPILIRTERRDVAQSTCQQIGFVHQTERSTLAGDVDQAGVGG